MPGEHLTLPVADFAGMPLCMTTGNFGEFHFAVPPFTARELSQIVELAETWPESGEKRFREPKRHPLRRYRVVGMRVDGIPIRPVTNSSRLPEQNDHTDFAVTLPIRHHRRRAIRVAEKSSARTSQTGRPCASHATRLTGSTTSLYISQTLCSVSVMMIVERGRSVARKQRWHTRRKPTPKQPGLAPGTLVVDPHSPPPVMHIMAFDGTTFVERPMGSVAELAALIKSSSTCWLNVDGLGDTRLLRELAQLFHIHPLALEDVVHVHQRPKLEEYSDQVFICTYMAKFGESLETEQVSLFVGRNFVVTFQEHPGWDSFDLVRERFRKGDERLLRGDAGYLAYSLLDAIIDSYFPLLEQIGDRLEGLEDRILLKADSETIAEIHAVKRDLVHLRRCLWPQRDFLNALVRDPLPHIGEGTRPYFRDCLDHSLRLIEIVESYREICADLMDLYLSSISNRTNDIMKVLTIISTLFIPLTFVSGVYGMNFHTESSPWNMPELNFYFGYPLCLSLMALISLVQFVFFYRKGWIGPTRAGEIAKEDPPR